MNIRVTRVVYSIFILIFLGLSAYLLFYGLGYRFNFDKNTIEKTGALFIKSYPRGANIYVNEKIYKDKTPAVVNRLLANNYQIKVAKEGYHDWQKTLTVYPR